MLPLHRRVVKAWRVLLGTDPIGLSGLTPRDLARDRKRAPVSAPAGRVVIVNAGGGDAKAPGVGAGGGGARISYGAR